MISLWELQNESLSETIASRSEELFEEHIGKPQLELYRLNTFSTAKGHGNYTRAETVEVNDHAELKASSTVAHPSSIIHWLFSNTNSSVFKRCTSDIHHPTRANLGHLAYLKAFVAWVHGYFLSICSVLESDTFLRRQAD